MSIEFVDLRKQLGGRPVLDGITLSVAQAQVLFIVGASGAGKSVLMRHVVGLLRPDSGEVHVDGLRVDTLGEHELHRVRRRCGFVFQHPTLFDFLSVIDNVAMPLQKRLHLARPEARERAGSWLRRVGVETDFDRAPTALGAGVQKRVAIARALALEPRYVVYDEPTTGLDPPNARRIDRVIRELAEDTGVTSIVVSHDRKSIFGVADRIAFLHQGRLRFTGDPDALRESDDAVVRQFVSGSPEGPMELR